MTQERQAVSVCGDAPLSGLLTVREAAGLLRVSERQVYRWIAEAHLPGVRRIGRAVFLSATVLNVWLRQDGPATACVNGDLLSPTQDVTTQDGMGRGV